MSDNSNLIAKLTKLLNLDKDKVIDHVADMAVDNILEVVDALNNDDADRARELLGVDEDGEMAGQDVEAPVAPEQDVEADVPEEDGVSINPLFHRSAAKKTAKKKEASVAEEDDADEDFVPNIGDDVLVGDEEGTVKIAKAPGNTVGVQIDGEMVMVDKKDVRRNRVDEGLLGLTALPDLRRMQELAGLAPAMDAERPEECAITKMPVGGATSPLAAGTFDVAPIAPAANDEVSLPLDTQAAATMGAESPHWRGSPCMDFGGVLQSFDEIEAALPELRVKDAKVIRDRLNNLMTKLNETQFTRRKKD